MLNNEPTTTGYKGFLLSAMKEEIDRNEANVFVFYDNVGEITVWGSTKENLKDWLNFIRQINSHADCINFPPHITDDEYSDGGYSVKLAFRLKEHKRV